MTKRKKWDLKSPETAAMRDEIVHGTFITEGFMFAFPLCFPGASAPLRADESRITVLDVDAKGNVYGGTSGHAAHLFVGMFHGATGIVFDMGTAEGATSTAAMCCGLENWVAGVNGPAGGRVVRRRLQPLPFDLLQEWGFERTPFEDLGEPAPGEAVVHGLALKDRKRAVIATEGHLAIANLAEGPVRPLGEAPVQGRIGLASDGSVLGLDEDETLWSLRPDSGEIERRAISLPEGEWRGDVFRFSRPAPDGTLYVADATGRLFAYHADSGFSQCLGQTPLAPVGPMSVTFDGRLFGHCGEGIGKTFRYDPVMKDLALTGVAVSVIERRRYGYQFGDAVTGREGQIFYGENDDLGHVWLYFPRVLARLRTD